MRILIIEDEPRIASSIKRALESQNFAVDVVADGDNGLGAAYDSDYDLIILDRMLPGSINGLDICREIRGDNIHTPILMLTALTEVSQRVEGLQSGADDYLVKPFSMQELITRVQVLLRRPNQSLGVVLKVKDLELNPISFEVKRRGIQIDLSAREFKLLAYLLYHPGQVISKDKIINHVWDEDSLIMPNTIEVYISSLRQKIDKAFPRQPALIKTVRGFGYRVGN